MYESILPSQVEVGSVLANAARFVHTTRPSAQLDSFGVIPTRQGRALPTIQCIRITAASDAGVVAIGWLGFLLFTIVSVGSLGATRCAARACDPGQDSRVSVCQTVTGQTRQLWKVGILGTEHGVHVTRDCRSRYHEAFQLRHGHELGWHRPKQAGPLYTKIDKGRQPTKLRWERSCQISDEVQMDSLDAVQISELRRDGA
mmetsp:Transcript_5182/g.15150  ORF Transcript_5182/g.15150 Transcript_5182/m.15150 type:complete len:201 (-) Transcript_5182:712-1314(-)